MKMTSTVHVIFIHNMNENVSCIIFHKYHITWCTWYTKCHIITCVYPNVGNVQHSLHLSLYYQILIPKHVSFFCAMQSQIYTAICKEKENVSLITYSVAEICIQNDNPPAAKNTLHCSIMLLEFNVVFSVCCPQAQ